MRKHRAHIDPYKPSLLEGPAKDVLCRFSLVFALSILPVFIKKEGKEKRKKASTQKGRPRYRVGGLIEALAKKNNAKMGK